MGINNALKGVQHPKAKLTEQNVIKIRELYKTGKYTTRELGSMFSTAYSSIGQIVRYETWRHLP